VSSWSELDQVSCSSSTACTAIGFFVNTSRTARLPLVERWDGTSWTIQRTPRLGRYVLDLAAVSCPSDNACVAVGLLGKRGPDQPVAERWAGATSTIQKLPGAGTLKAVSCSSDVACIAVGYPDAASGRPMAERWNGRSWKIIATTRPRGAYGSQLLAVSCPATNACTAIGGAQRSCPATAPTCNTEPPLAEHWNGATWTIQNLPGPGPDASASPTALSCPSAGLCIAVGSRNNSPGSPSAPLGEQWDGTRWTIQDTPDLGDSGSLNAISCVATPTIACLAIGGSKTGTLIARYS
jgi:hypothetical protein